MALTTMEKTLHHERFIFVFGANQAGRHGKGAALSARRFYGATPGVGEGRQGSSYAIPTKDENLQTLTLPQISEYVGRFIEHTTQYPNDHFMLTRIGCGLAGLDDQRVSALFDSVPANVWFPRQWQGESDTFRVIVAGPRDLYDRDYVFSRLDHWFSNIPGDRLEIVNGDCSGVDTLASDYARNRSLHLTRCPAAFSLFGNPAGPMRNRFMAWYADGAAVLYRSASKGSRDMIKTAREEGLSLRSHLIG